MPINKYVRIGFFTLLGLAVLSASQSIDPRQAVIEVSLSAALCYLALFTARLYHEHHERLIKVLACALWISIALYMLSFYTGYISAVAVGKKLAWPHPFFGFSNIRLFQQYQLWTMGFICLPLLAFNLKKNIRFCLYVALTCWWVLLFYAASRGVILGLLIATLITGIVYKKLAWPFLRIQIFNAFSGLCLYQILFKLVPMWVISAASSGSENTITTSSIFRDTFSDRIDLWKVALVMIYNFPTLGVGPMHFYFYNSFGTHPHNSILRLAAEYGLPATVIIFLIVGYSLYCWMQRFNIHNLKTTTTLNQHLSIVLFFTVTASAAYSFVEGVVLMPISQVLMFTMIGLMIGQYMTNRWSSSDANSTQNKISFRPVFAIVVLVFLSASTLPELKRGLSQDSIYSINERRFSIGPNIINPRIWMQQRRVEKK